MRLKITKRDGYRRPIEAACGVWTARKSNEEGTAWALYRGEEPVFACASLERCQWAVDLLADENGKPR